MRKCACGKWMRDDKTQCAQCAITQDLEKRRADDTKGVERFVVEPGPSREKGTTTMPAPTRTEEELVHEYPQVSRYRVRILRKEGKTVALDVREYVDAEKFTGFTRRGIRLNSLADVKALRAALADAEARGWFE